jgi:hypothetical protein
VRAVKNRYNIEKTLPLLGGVISNLFHVRDVLNSILVPVMTLNPLIALAQTIVQENNRDLLI